ncbi:MAG TPA: anti-sigma factor [Candidatus Binataceae bacterium]|jgi:anti-sigma factor RsiW|nr:anti-sigma factor [Candidatus Binataceae bacterium]
MGERGDMRVNCTEARALLHAYSDGELGLESALEFERHLEQCVECTRERAALAALSAALGDPALRFSAPDALRRRVGAALAGEATSGAVATGPLAPSARTGAWRRGWSVGGRSDGGGSLGWAAGWVVAGAALAMLALVMFNGGGLRSRPFGDGPLFDGGVPADVIAREVLTSHLRSLMPGHLLDVVSTDQHTVKPWFDGRVDFSPPVADFAAAGFRLIGGRLDYLDGRPVAALVYQRRKHIVNVFVWPSPDGSQSAVETTAHDGYNLLHWRRGGMNYWMASDLNAQEMNSFTGLLRAADAPSAPHP